MFTDGMITKIVGNNIENVTTPDLDGATFDVVVYVYDSNQPIWPGSALPVATDFAQVEDITLATNSERYAMLP